MRRKHGFVLNPSLFTKGEEKGGRGGGARAPVKRTQKLHVVASTSRGQRPARVCALGLWPATHEGRKVATLQSVCEV